MFEATTVLEEDVVHKFVEKYCHDPSSGANGNVTGRKRTFSARELLDREPALQGEQVAARMKTDEEGNSWILANVVDFDHRAMSYAVQDEDDPSRILILSFDDVRRLEDTSSHLKRGDQVLAVFPETTSFYRAIVAKNPKPPLHANAHWDVVVKFNDDEDDAGKSIARRVPARFVLKRSDIGDEDEDYDDNED